MCYPYKLELEIESDLEEALLLDSIINNTKALKAVGSSMCVTVMEQLKEKYQAGIKKHKAEKHPEKGED